MLKYLESNEDLNLFFVNPPQPQDFYNYGLAALEILRSHIKKAAKALLDYDHALEIDREKLMQYQNQ